MKMEMDRACLADFATILQINSFGSLHFTTALNNVFWSAAFPSAVTDASRDGKQEFLRSDERTPGALLCAEGMELSLKFQGMRRGCGKLSITCLKLV